MYSVSLSYYSISQLLHLIILTLSLSLITSYFYSQCIFLRQCPSFSLQIMFSFI